MLLEEPELSLHSAIVSKLPGIFHRLQRRQGRQLFVSTHSGDLLSDRGIGGEEVIVIRPGPEGSVAELASSTKEIVDLLAGGLSIADVVLPRTAPSSVSQLSLDLSA